MAKRKGESISTINRRLKNLYEDKNFGPDSEEYKLAEAYIRDRVKDDYLYTVKEGKKNAGLLQIKQTEEAKADTAILGRSTVLQEYVPTVYNMYSKEYDALYKEYDSSDLIENPLKGIKKTDALKNNNMLSFLRDRIIATTEALNDYDAIVDDIYRVRDNSWSSTFANRAQDLLDERGKTRDWVRRARQLVADFDEAEAEEIRRKEQNGEL